MIKILPPQLPSDAPDVEAQERLLKILMSVFTVDPIANILNVIKEDDKLADEKLEAFVKEYGEPER